MSVNHYEPLGYQNQPVAEHKKPGPLRKLWHLLGKIFNVIRIVIKTFVYIFLILFLFSIFGANVPKPLPEKFALTVTPKGFLVDEKSFVDPLTLMLADDNDKDRQTLVRDLVEAIGLAASDDRVTHLVLQLARFEGGGISKMKEIGQALENFKKSGKKIIAVSENYSQEQYFLASFADEILMHEMGTIEITGYARYQNYYKSALDSLGVTIHAFRSGKYKDYLEPFLRDNMSEESREHNREWINQLWTEYTNQIETARELPAGTLNDLINNLDAHITLAAGDMAKLAQEKNLVDQKLSRQGLETYLQQTIGAGKNDELYSSASVRDYLAEKRRGPQTMNDKVAVIVASGNIMDGDYPEGTIGGDTFVELVRKVRDDKQVKALVIRIDSGGGSAFASEIIRSEIAALRAQRSENYPIYISMGSVAASGGYWMATAGDQIWAQPTTITGSIGVFGAFPTLENSLKKIGISTDGVGTTELAGDLRLDRTLSEKGSRVIQASVDHIYQRFIHLVADARKLTPEQVDEIAQGHVWTGSKAQELGLVDKLGNLQDVIAAAAETAKLDKYKVEIVQRTLSPREEFMRSLLESGASFAKPGLTKNLQFLNQFQPLVKPLEELKQLQDPQGIYVKCFECVGL